MTFEDVMYLLAAFGAVVLFLPATAQAMTNLLARWERRVRQDDTGEDD